MYDFNVAFIFAKLLTMFMQLVSVIFTKHQRALFDSGFFAILRCHLVEVTFVIWFLVGGMRTLEILLEFQYIG